MSYSELCKKLYRQDFRDINHQKRVLLGYTAVSANTGHNEKKVPERPLIRSVETDHM